MLKDIYVIHKVVHTVSVDDWNVEVVRTDQNNSYSAKESIWIACAYVQCLLEYEVQDFAQKWFDNIPSHLVNIRTYVGYRLLSDNIEILSTLDWEGTDDLESLIATTVNKTGSENMATVTSTDTTTIEYPGTSSCQQNNN